jgi:stress-induced morphogen
MTVCRNIEETIRANIPDAKILVHNANDDGEHFEAVVISEQFDALPLLKQHQAVMTPLKAALKTSVHALALKTFGLKQWNETQSKYPLIAEKLKEKYK